jgi:putative ABC transport system permease protein
VWKAVWKGLLAQKLRLALTGLAIVLGVGFVAGTYVLTDTMNRAFDDLFADVTKGVDAYVSARGGTQSPTSFSPKAVPEALLEKVSRIEGVESARGSVQGFAQIVDENGEAIVPNGPPTLGTTWVEGDESDISSGRPPEGRGEVAVDFATANEHDLEVGDEVRVIFQDGARRFQIVGIVGSEDGAGTSLGATVAMFDLATGQRLLGSKGELSEIRVTAAEGVSDTELVERINDVLPRRYEAATAGDTAAEQSGQIKRELSFFNVFLLAFAAIALFVGAFLIFNTFSVVVAQKTREYALLRTLGATGAQVTRSVFVEALLVGAVFSALGVGAGFGIALGLGAMFSAFGIDLPTTDLVLQARTLVVAMLTGTIVTVAASLAPARRAARISPMAALREAAPAHEGRGSRKRALVGGLLAAGGAGLLWAGLNADVPQPVVFVGVGAALVFLAVAALGPLFAGPLATAIGAPLKRPLRVPGQLAQANAARNPKRTAATASALMIGVALVSMTSVLSASLKESTAAALERNLRADFIISGGSGVGSLVPISGKVAKRMRKSPEIAATTPLRLGAFREGGGNRFLVGADVDTLSQTVNIGVAAGDVRDLGDGGVFLARGAAQDRGLEVGDRLVMRFPRTGRTANEVEGIYTNKDVIGSDYLISLQSYERYFTDRLDFMIFATAAPGATGREARAAVERATADFPSVEVSDQGEFRRRQEQSINQLLGMVSALLGLALLIAFLGITNTLALAVLERTRELGLLRAVGMTKRQTRSMIRWEASIVAVIGALMGAAVGCGFGWALVTALESEGIAELAIPLGQLAAYGVAAGVAGVVAGMPPARRAARLDVLEAVAAE